jgi:hypothetical protein
MATITGFDKFSRVLDEAQEALAALGSELDTVKFNPHDPASIETAIKQIESTVDHRLGAYASNAIIGPLAEKLKETYRQGIIDRALAARLSGGGRSGQGARSIFAN